MKTLIAIDNTVKTSHYSDVNEYCSNLTPTPSTIVCLGENWPIERELYAWAQLHGIHIEFFPRDVNRYGRFAGHVSNREVVEVVDHIIVFTEGGCETTESLILLSEKAHKDITVLTL